MAHALSQVGTFTIQKVFSAKADLRSVWDVAPPGVSVELAKWSAHHFQQHGRPLRLAIDAHYWQDHFESDEIVSWLDRSLFP